MKILILGAAGQIAQLLRQKLLAQTDAELILYARNASRRITKVNKAREQIVDGDFNELAKLTEAMQGVAVVYVNAMGDKEAIQAIMQAMKETGVTKIIGATILGIYDEVAGTFGEWNKRMVGTSRIKQQAESTRLVEDSEFDYTLLRLTWLYNQQGNTQYSLTFKGEPFVGAQVTRQAVAQLIVDIIKDKTGRFARASLGVSEPNTDWPKPSFY